MSDSRVAWALCELLRTPLHGSPTSEKTQPVEKVGVGQVGGPGGPENKAKTLQKRRIRPPNLEQNRARRGFSTGWSILRSSQAQCSKRFVSASLSFLAVSEPLALPGLRTWATTGARCRAYDLARTASRGCRG